MKVKLKVLTGKNAGQLIALPVNEFVIGREAGCHLRPQSDAFSPRHCAILHTDDEVRVRDLGSVTGTFVNGERVEGERALASGDRLRVGPLEFEVVLEVELGGAKRERVKDVADVAARLVAQASRTSGDVDIDEFLKEDEPAGGSRPPRRVFSLDEIKAVPKRDEQDEAEKKPQEPAKKEPKKLPGKLPSQPTAAAKDTREAASEMLKRLWKHK
jgi:pSer/pThr/pTyr-binding forkhead associated (FHA) protein